MQDDVERISSFQRDDMSVGARKARSKSTARRALPRRPDPLGPTRERLAKADAPLKLGSGLYRAPPSIERMRDRGQLAPGDAHLNAMMFLAAEKLEQLAMSAGLGGGIRSMDLARIGGGTGGDLGDERAAHCLKEFRAALTLMGWFSAYPNRGAGRITVAVVCDGMSVTEAASVYRPGGSNSARLGAGMDVLREGLFSLAVHWRFVRG